MGQNEDSVKMRPTANYFPYAPTIQPLHGQIKQAVWDIIIYKATRLRSEKHVRYWKSHRHL